jgi:hypothetical protein
MAFEFDYPSLSEQQLRSMGTREALLELQSRAGGSPVMQKRQALEAAQAVPPAWMAEGQVQYPEEPAANVTPTTQDVGQPGLVEFGRSLRKPIDERFQQLGAEVAALPEPAAPGTARETVGKFGERSFTDQPESAAPSPGGGFVKGEGGPAPPTSETFGPMDSEIRGLMARLKGLDAYESELFAKLDQLAPGDPRRGAILDVIQRALPEHRKQTFADMEQRTALGTKMFGLQEKATEAVGAPTKREVFGAEKGLKEKEVASKEKGQIFAGAEAAKYKATADVFEARLKDASERSKAELTYKALIAKIQEQAEEADKEVLKQSVLPLMQHIITEKKDGKAPTADEVMDRLGRMGEGLGRLRKGLRGKPGEKAPTDVKVGDTVPLPAGAHRDKRSGRVIVVDTSGKVVKMQ